MIRLYICVGLILASVRGWAQELLTVKEAVELALENNYDIRLSKNDLLIAEENVTYGNAGMLPSVTANFTQNNSVQNSTQIQNTGVERSLDNAKNNNMNYGVSVGWTIFDGLGMFSRYETLEELRKQGDVFLKRTILTRVSDVIDRKSTRLNSSHVNISYAVYQHSSLRSCPTRRSSDLIQNTGVERSLDNAKNNNMNYGVSVGWTIFDGLGMFSRYETLEELRKQGDVFLKRTILTRVSDVIRTYYTIVEQQNLLEAMDTTIMISQERLQIAENRFAIGKASRLEVLNVQVNLNEDQTNKVKQEEVVNNLKITLNNLLARDLNTDFDVIRDVEV